MRPLMWRKPGDILTEQLDPSGVRAHVAADLVKQRGLVGAVGADDQAPLTGPDRERYLLGHLQAAECLVQAGDLQRVAGRYAHDARPRRCTASLCQPGTIPVGITSTMNRKTRPSSMF